MPSATTTPVHQDGIGGPDGLERLWTPYRMAYLRGENKPADASAGECPFCRIPARRRRRAPLVVRRGELAYAVLNLYPYAPGHLMVCPYRHIADYTDTTAEEAAEIAALTKAAMRVAAGGVERRGLQHRHEPGRGRRRRASPRTCTSTSYRGGSGDQNFMPVIGSTKTLPQLLQETRALLADHWPA